MGRDKFSNLILTAREDHSQDSPNYSKEGPKIHFDLSGYDILFWHPQNLDRFRQDLEKRVKRRLAAPIAPASASGWDKEWISKHQSVAFTGLKECGKSGFMEIRMVLRNFQLLASQRELFAAAEQAQIRTFGWPLGVVLQNDEARPKPKADGIFAEVKAKHFDSYDYWTVRKDGAYYLLKSLFEDQRAPGHLFSSTRIKRVTEALLYATRLYSSLRVPEDSSVSIGIRHGGLRDRILTSTGGIIQRDLGKSGEDEVDTEIKATLAEIQSNLVAHVSKFIQPLFILFDFFEVDEKVLETTVKNFATGKSA